MTYIVRTYIKYFFYVTEPVRERLYIVYFYCIIYNLVGWLVCCTIGTMVTGGEDAEKINKAYLNGIAR